MTKVPGAPCRCRRLGLIRLAGRLGARGCAAQQPRLAAAAASCLAALLDRLVPAGRLHDQLRAVPAGADPGGDAVADGDRVGQLDDLFRVGAQQASAYDSYAPLHWRRTPSVVRLSARWSVPGGGAASCSRLPRSRPGSSRSMCGSAASMPTAAGTVPGCARCGRCAPPGSSAGRAAAWPPRASPDRPGRARRSSSRRSRRGPCPAVPTADEGVEAVPDPGAALPVEHGPGRGLQHPVRGAGDRAPC